VAAAGLLAALALVFTNATGVTEVATDARLQQQVEASLGATAATRNAIGHALLIVGMETDPLVTAASIDEAETVLAALEQRVAFVSGSLDDPSRLDEALQSVILDGRATLAALAEGDVITAGEIVNSSTVGSFDELTTTLADLRDVIGNRIAAAAGESSTVATASRFMVAFFIPTLAVVVGLFAVRRRRRRELLATALEHERSLNRSKDQLIANLSHELRTPLTGIYTAALALEDTGFAEPSLSTELNGMIIEQSADLTRMVEDLLVSAQADAGRLRFDLEPTVVADVVRSLAPEFRRAGLTIDIDLEAVHVLVDPGRLRQILRNLVSNAIRYGGDSIRIDGTTTPTTYLLRVSDSGPGVPPEVEKRLFDRFVHQGDTPLVVGSVGLGLAICRVLARGMLGDVTYRRVAERSIFEVSLRREVDPADEMPADPAPHEMPTLMDEESIGPTQIDQTRRSA
jgi:signal transduction histidine kinase